MTSAPPERIEVDDSLHLRWLVTDDADDVARAVGESLDHLKPWMPWADAQSADPRFQRERLRNHPQQRARGEEWQYGIFADDRPGIIGAIGLMTRRGPGTLEIGYWLHVDAGGRGHMTNAARALTEAGLQVDGIDQMIIVCDEANVRSAAVPRRLGYALDRVETRAPEAPAETGRMQIWVSER
jgi:RimJ/RimL family protein N-acetyltransferase